MPIILTAPLNVDVKIRSFDWMNRSDEGRVCEAIVSSTIQEIGCPNASINGLEDATFLKHPAMHRPSIFRDSGNSGR